jgi:hypothetical protein
MALTVAQDPVRPLGLGLVEEGVADRALERTLGRADILIAPAVPHRAEAPETVCDPSNGEPLRQVKIADLSQLGVVWAFLPMGSSEHSPRFEDTLPAVRPP